MSKIREIFEKMPALNVVYVNEKGDYFFHTKKHLKTVTRDEALTEDINAEEVTEDVKALKQSKKQLEISENI